jgi:hypothetical protein
MPEHLRWHMMRLDHCEVHSMLSQRRILLERCYLFYSMAQASPALGRSLPATACVMAAASSLGSSASGSTSSVTLRTRSLQVHSRGGRQCTAAELKAMISNP